MSNFHYFCYLLVLAVVVLAAAAAVEVRQISSIPGPKRKGRADDNESFEDDEDDDKKPAAARPSGNKTAEKLSPVTIASFRGFVHRVDSSDVTILDEKTLEIPDFTYDGEGPASWFVVGNDGDYTSERVDLPDITVIPDENESCDSLRRYTGQTIRLVLPGKLKVYDISYLSLYCLRFNHNFGYVSIPDDIKVPKAGKDTPKLEECENVESSESGGPAQGNRPPPQALPQPVPDRRPGGLVGGLLNLLG